MKTQKLLLSKIALICCFINSYGQKWNLKSENVIKSENVLNRPNKPNFYKIYSLDLNDIKNKLSNAPQRDLINLNQNGVKVKFPIPNGEHIEFNVVEVNDFEKGLSAKFPTFKSYTGSATHDKSTKINFTINALGVNAIITSPKFSTIYLDTYSNDLKNYIVYHRADLDRVKAFTCHTVEPEIQGRNLINNFETSARNSNSLFREYRLAMACTVEYATFHVNRNNAQNQSIEQKKQIVLSAMQTTVNRVNMLYERDMAIRLNLVANNDQIIFINSDNFTNDDGGVLIDESQTVIDNIIGFSNYDIGHTVSTGGGGLAQLYSPCSPNKARGITGSGSPINDPYDIDYVAHEVGHQFGATHTFNNSCDRNISTSSSYEPGSGSTIMGYAGICAPNVQRNSDDHFHNHSIAQMSNFINQLGTCARTTNTSNTAPVIQQLSNYTIPNGTAFKLTANATDNQNDALTYVWEQMNREVSTQPPVSSSVSGPNYKSVRPSTSPTRYFPEFTSVLEGNLTPTWEVTPSVARTLNFAVTVRDNNQTVPQTKIAQNTVTIANTGPFTITYPNTENIIWQKNSQQTITWNVAGTTANNINVNTVKILLTTDNGNTFTTLAESTPNDGSETITIPDVATTNGRIIVEANGNIFYAVSKKIVIGYTVTTEEVCRDYSMSFNASLSQQNAMYTINIPVMENFNINNTKLYVNLTSDRSTDIQIFLKNPNETNDYTNLVFGNVNCSNSQNLIATFENSTNAISCTNLNTNTTIRPTQRFNTIGTNSAGIWTIYVGKTSNRNVVLNQLRLTLCGTVTTYTLSSNENEIKNFTLYPNPNNGIFKVDFEPKSSNIEIEVYDIRGRKIYNKIYETVGNTNFDLNLSNVSKGVYVVKVTDGDLTKTQKIIIQ